MQLKRMIATSIVIASTLSVSAIANADDSELAKGYTKTVLPLLQQYCLDCHGADDPEAMLNLSRFNASRDIVKNFGTWQHVVDRVGGGEMPPEDAEQPPDEARKALLRWSTLLREYEANRNAGDPGPVLARRLSAAEYDNTIRDLTGVDIRPARQFPVDPANKAGFDNSGESLAMTPGLLAKYLDAARAVSDHLVLQPDGLGFAPHPVIVDTDRDKYCVRRIVDFYERQYTEYADFFYAAWRLRQRSGLDDPGSELVDVAEQAGISPKYLRTVWSLLAGREHHYGPIAKLRSMWFSLPDDTEELEQVRAGCSGMSALVQRLRPQLAHTFPYLSHKRINNGTQPFVLWRNRQYATSRMTLNTDALQVAPEDPKAEKERIARKNREIEEAKQARGAEIEDQLAKLSADLKRQVDEKKITKYQAENRIEITEQRLAKELAKYVLEDNAVEELYIPAEESLQNRHIDAFREFCAVFPDTFFVKSRGRDYEGLAKQGAQFENEAKVRLLSAGFHSQMGYFRDDAPLYNLSLSEAEQRELDTLWHELNFIANVPQRQHQGYIWYERGESSFLTGPEFDFARPENKDMTSKENIRRLADLYLAKAARTGASEQALDAIQDHFFRVSSNIRQVESAKKNAEAAHVRALKEFAARAYRRPLIDSEQSSIEEFYQSLRSRGGLTHEDAVRDVLVRILTSPHFCFSTQPSDEEAPIHPLSQHALASRLCYFLWSSMPDPELLASAQRGELNDPAVLKWHVWRMLQDDRIRGFTTQFGGNWLGYANFEDHKGIDRGRFPQFDDELRSAMFEEPTRFLIDLLRRDGSLLDVLYANHTFANAKLAEHYGIDSSDLQPGQWKRIDQADKYGRGGMLPMSVFLTKNAHPLRTSPVQRGYWVVRQLLGERIPAPPADVPDLPQDESKLGELTLAEVLAKHREQKNCAACHDRFDALGIAMEGFGPIGDLRKVDLGGREIETSALLPDGIKRNGVSGLRAYIREHREQDFIDNTCQKLLSYALSRSLIVPDDVLLDTMHEQLEQSDYRFVHLIETIVTSPPFLNQRGRNYRYEE